MRRKVVVSHSGKQYVHQLLYALQKENRLQLFFTSIWYKPDLLIYRLITSIPKFGPVIFNKFLKKKTYPFQKPELIKQYPWKELKRQILGQFSNRFRNERYVFEVEKAHDKYVASRLRALKPEIFIGYEKSSLESFKEVKKQGGTTVLDLAQVHYNFLIELYNTQETFKGLFDDEELFEEINKRKAAEYELADYILTLSEFAKQTLLGNGIAASKVKVVNLGYDPVVFLPKVNYRLHTSDTKIRIIFAGTFTRRKGVHLLLEAVKELMEEVELIIIGPVLDGEDLFITYKGVFTHYDFLHHEEMVKHLQEADLYVFPSYLDSWAMTVIEAMACGLPVIITENTGAKDAVKNNESGLILPVNDLQALKNAIFYFIKNRTEIERMGRNAASSARHYTWENYYKQISETISK